MMKQLQLIATISVTNDEYSELLNKSVSIESLVLAALENDEDTVSFDFPAVLIPRLNND